MLQKTIVIFVIVLSLVYCDQKNNTDNTTQNKSDIPKKAHPGNSDESKLDKIISQIDNLQNKISKIESLSKRIPDLEKRITEVENKSSTPVPITKAPRHLTKAERKRIYNQYMAHLRKSIQKKIAQSQVLIKRISPKKKSTYKPIYKNYRIYVGSFQSFNNALARKRHIGELGVPVRVVAWPWKYGYLYMSDRDKFNPDSNAYYENGSYPRYDSRGGNLYKIETSNKYTFNKAVEISQYLISRGYPAIIKKY